MYKVIITSEFSSEIAEARGPWDNIFNMIKVKKVSTNQLRILYQAKLYSKNEGKLKLFFNKHN